MNNKYYSCLQFSVIFLCFFILSCNDNDKNSNTINTNTSTTTTKKDIVLGNDIKDILLIALKNNGKIDDSITLNLVDIVNDFYNSTDYDRVWSKRKSWKPLADSLYNFINNAAYYGLFSKDYHFKTLQLIKTQLSNDSTNKISSIVWEKADILFTDAFLHIVKDLKQGRLLPDSISLNKDSVLPKEFYLKKITALLEDKKFTPLLNELQPKHKGYWNLKNGLKFFVDSMDNRSYTYIAYPFKKGDINDSIYFFKTLKKRLIESNTIDNNTKVSDSVLIIEGIKKYQRQKGLKIDGKLSTSLVKMMNTSDAERFKRIAITLDRYKQLPDKMPEKYIWVNLPAYNLLVIDHDTIALESKVICGKPDTRTPLLNSQLTDMVTYPKWTIPNSIVLKSLLPKLKNNPGYLKRLGYKLVGGSGKDINPYAVKWGKYNKGIPYSIQQGSGDNNALGIFKFNFNNPYSVYLHDTNQRYLFKNSSRALSHGCVRVQEWDKLAYYIAKNDSATALITDTLKYNSDSIKNWIKHKENRKMLVKNKIPIFIRYFSCEGIDGKIKFYDDIYGEDKLIREKYFIDK